MKSTFRSGAPLALNQIVCEGCAFARNLILARLLEPEQMGRAVSLALALRLVEMIGEFGWERLLVQAEQNALAPLRRTVHGLQQMKAGAQTTLAALLCVSVLTWASLDLEPFALCLIATSLLIRGAIHFDYREHQRDHRFTPALLVEGGSNLIAVLAVLPAVWLTEDHTAFAWAILAQAIACVVISHAVATRPYAVGLDDDAMRRCVRYGAPIAANSLLMFAALQGDRVVVALNYSAAELASFALAAQLALLPALMGARLILAMELPRFAQLLGDQPGLATRFGTDLLMVSLIGAALVGILGSLGNLFIETLYGAAYPTSASVLWLLSLTAGLRLARAVPGTLLMATEKTARLLWTNLPRLIALPLGLWLAAHGTALHLLVALGALCEAIGLGIALLATACELNRLKPVPEALSYQGAM